MWSLKLCAVICSLFLWQCAVSFNWILPSAISSPLSGVDYLVMNPTNLIKNLGISLIRLSIGVIIGFVAGLFTGAFAGNNKYLHSVIGIHVKFLAPVPVIIWIPVVIGLTNYVELQKLILVALPAYLMTHMLVYDKIKEDYCEYRDVCDIYEKSQWSRFTEVLVPLSIRVGMTSLRLCVYLGWITLFFAEYSQSGNSPGLGYYICDARSLLQTEKYTAGLLVMIIATLIIDKMILLITKKPDSKKINFNQSFIGN